MCFAYGGEKGLGEGCDGFMKPVGALPGVSFVGKSGKRVLINTTRGGQVPGDDVYQMYVAAPSTAIALMNYLEHLLVTHHPPWTLDEPSAS